MIQTIEDFITEFNNIKKMGWVKTHRSGPTGIGKTLEDLLGISENNFNLPDFGDYELKSCRISSSSMLTMFTLAPLPRGSNTYLRKTYGYSSNAYDNDERVLHSTLTASRFVQIHDTGFSLKIVCDDEKIAIASQTKVENVYWSKERLKRIFEKKYKGKFIYVKAESRGTGKNEEFRFIEAFEISGFDYEAFVNLLEKGKIFIDLRIGQYPNGKTHDHGTAFRIKETDHHLLFKTVKQIG